MVRVQVTNNDGKGKRAEGKITDVAERKQTEFIGNVQVSKTTAFFITAGEKPVPDFYIPIEKLNGAKDGERVLARFVKWDKGDKKPQGEVVTIIKAEDEADMAMKEIILDAGFPLAFEPLVLEEAEKLSGKISR
jgi:ribonuclease R